MPPYLKLLGANQAVLDSQTTNIKLGRPSSLLIYLACKNKEVKRSELAFLYHPEQNRDSAFKYLRLLIYRAKKIDWAKDLKTGQHHLELTIKTDCYEFNEAILEKNWLKAIELYKGDFLKNFSLAKAATFNTWLELEREQYKQKYRLALNKQIEIYDSQENFQASADLAIKVYNLDKLDETALQNCLYKLYFAQQKDLALKYYQEFTKILAKELDIEPLESSQKLIQEIKYGKLSQDKISPTAKTTLPYQNTHFVGRKNELSELNKLLARPDCRLLTINAIGGMGKTRLALELAKAQAANFADGVFFIALSEANSREQIVQEIAKSLNIKLNPKQPTDSQLFEQLSTKQSLLILDNFEHLLEHNALISELLTKLEKLKLVITSRVPVNIPSEWLFDLHGLDYSQENSEAITLFANAIKRQDPKFQINSSNLEIVGQIAKKLAGLPLALELAASWKNSYS
ncbi:MAG TPA: hypothetical protein ENK21_09535, partial [Trueperaceae bacterium]|nr:hypothetical protein [Trueperaceae bacterium]